MAAESIQQNSLPWQVRHWGKNLSEWIQLQLSGNPEPERPPPSFEFPAWIGEMFFWLVVAVGVVWLAWVVVQLIDQYRASRRGPQKQVPLIQTIAAAPTRSVGDWLRESRQFEQAGNWREACRALYMAALQLLHDRGFIPHQASRTDGEYWQAVQALQRPRPWQLLIRTHERSLFGGEALTAENLQRCRQAYEEIEKR